MYLEAAGMTWQDLLADCCIISMRFACVLLCSKRAEPATLHPLSVVTLWLIWQSYVSIRCAMQFQPIIGLLAG